MLLLTFAETWVLVEWTGAGDEGSFSIVNSKNVLSDSLIVEENVMVKDAKGKYRAKIAAVGMLQIKYCFLSCSVCVCVCVCAHVVRESSVCKHTMDM